jgi:antitoxin component of MazEF toxin-antitoxin module
MLKKLITYENQKALVIDSALLDILNINDATQLKLSIDGKSLVITPVEGTMAESTQLSSMSDEEAFLHYQQLIMPLMQEAQQQMAQLPLDKQAALREETQAMMRSFDEKYNYTQEIMKLFSNPAYKADCAELARQAISTKMSQDEVYAAGTHIMQKHLPNVPLKEHEEAAKKLRAKYIAN